MLEVGFSMVNFYGGNLEVIRFTVLYMGVSLNGGTPHFTPQVLIIFSGKTHGFVGETHHFRVHPHRYYIIYIIHLIYFIQ